jgi:acyl carrier protein
MDSAAVDVSVPLTSLGLDSLVGIELRARLETDLQVKMPMTLLMQGPSISGLAAYFLEELNGAAAAQPKGPEEVIEIDVSGPVPAQPSEASAGVEREVVEL